MGAAVKTEPMQCRVRDVANALGMDLKTLRNLLVKKGACYCLGTRYYTTKALLRSGLPEVAEDLIARIPTWE